MCTHRVPKMPTDSTFKWVEASFADHFPLLFSLSCRARGGVRLRVAVPSGKAELAVAGRCSSVGSEGKRQENLIL